jgi:hypothetical protein
MRIRSISAALLLTALPLLMALAASPAAATSYVMVSDEALVDAAPLAVVGRIVSVDRSAALRGRSGTGAVTEYRVAVEEQLKGKAPSAALLLHVPGGMGRNGMGLKIYGAPRLRVGERALLFLEPDSRGGYRLVHFLLGAFHEVPAGERSLAVRNLQEASEMRVTAAGLEEVRPAAQETLRDFAAFAHWVKERANGIEGRTGYRVEDRDGKLRQITGKYTLFADPDGKNLRWFTFDSGGNVGWKAYATGQAGLTGGGYAEFETALKAWNAEAQTPIDYRYTGTTTSLNGLGTYDQINAVLFNDPNDDLPSFSCSTGGVLALGGPWYENDTTNFQGKAYHRIPNADIIINNGLSCFFASSPNMTKAAQELFGHELGHTLGLGHSCGDADGPDPSCSNPTFSDALMRAFVHDDSRGARLNSDDQAGIRSLYKQDGGNNPPAAPTHLTATPASTSEVHLAWQDNSSNETEFRIEVKVLGGTYADVAGVPANTTEADVSGLSPATGYSFRVRARNPQGDSAYSNEAQAATAGVIEACVAGAETLCLSNGRFRVEVNWKTADGQTGPGHVVTTSDSSGLLWFFEPSNWEVVVKVLNGCGEPNPRYWLFFAGATDVQYTVTVADTQTGVVKAYFNQLGSSAVETETDAFATCP